MKLALFGYGGHAREVACQIDQEVTFFVDEEYANEVAKPISEFNPEEYLMMVAVADSKDRADVVSKLPKETKYFTFIHPSVQIMDDNIEVGEGSFIGAGSILTTNIKIGKQQKKMVNIIYNTIMQRYLFFIFQITRKKNNFARIKTTQKYTQNFKKKL